MYFYVVDVVKVSLIMMISERVPGYEKRGEEDKRRLPVVAVREIPSISATRLLPPVWAVGSCSYHLVAPPSGIFMNVYARRLAPLDSVAHSLLSTALDRLGAPSLGASGIWPWG